MLVLRFVAPLQVVKGVDSSGLTLRQKVRLPPLRLGPQLLDIRDAYVTTLRSDHDIDVGEQRARPPAVPSLTHPRIRLFKTHPAVLESRGSELPASKATLPPRPA